ncbi:heavy-metal-associated domain-containing protein [Brumimicrobium aurantiacum]|uniref:Heavy-metal-associated domain-containing protein n=1 Tax=Brumimicrobium aurantiacum TaxID=1737063 RepID=A0A3E1EYA7_9FLAO|nr:heavy metal-associated domain-containing protein [Brumimicrobium aurantiacum]RFC54524.1 heavy-metal-associated domain-containing protein [Brumimicrobium aurantiacum]
MKNGILMIVMLLGLFVSCSNTKGTEAKPVAYIQTNAQCGECKERIEEALNYSKGVVYSNMDLETKIVEVKYNTNKTSLAEVKTIISNLGYDADDVTANKKAQAALPACCQPGGHD